MERARSTRIEHKRLPRCRTVVRKQKGEKETTASSAERNQTARGSLRAPADCVRAERWENQATRPAICYRNHHLRRPDTNMDDVRGSFSKLKKKFTRPLGGTRHKSDKSTGTSNWKSTSSASAKLLLRGVRDSSDAFGPLKSVAGGLCFILENCEVRPPRSYSARNAYRCLSEQRPINKR